MSWSIIKKNNQSSKLLRNNLSNADFYPEKNLEKSLGKLSSSERNIEKLSELNLKSALVDKHLIKANNQNLQQNLQQNLLMNSSKYLIKNFGAVAVGISANVTFNGNLFFECPVIIYGKFTGILSSSSSIIIAESAQVHGQIEAQKIVVFGNIESDLYAKELIELMPGSKVTGKIISKSLKMHTGAELNSTFSKISEAIGRVSINQNLSNNSFNSSQSNFDFSLIEEVCSYQSSIRQFGVKTSQKLITSDVDDQVTILAKNLTSSNSVDGKSNKVRKINKFEVKQNKLLSEQYVLPC